MAVFNSKFNINDTAYVVNADVLTLDAVIITDIRIRQSVTFPGAGPNSSVISYRGRTALTQKDFTESELMYLDEGKAALNIIISQKSATLGSMK